MVQKENAEDLQPIDYLIKAEKYGIPQRRHRVILIGVRKDLHGIPDTLKEAEFTTVRQVLSDLPPIRSTLSKEPDSMERWKKALCSVLSQTWYQAIPQSDLFEENSIPEKIRQALEAIPDVLHSGEKFHACEVGPERLAKWFKDERLGGVCNHIARSHITQ